MVNLSFFHQAATAIRFGESVQQVFNAWRHYAIPKRMLGPMKAICDKEPWARTPAEIEEIHKTVISNPYFARLPEEVRMELCRVLRLNFYDKDETVVKQGDQVRSNDEAFYVIMYGSVNVVKELEWGDETKHEHLATFGRGDSFGDAAAMIDNQARMATVVTAMPCWLCTCLRDDYRSALKHVHEREAKMKMDYCCRLPVFRGISLTDLYDIVSSMTPVIFPAGTRIIRQGSEPSSIYFVLSGQVEIAKEVILTLDYALKLFMGHGRGSSLQDPEVLRRQINRRWAKKETDPGGGVLKQGTDKESFMVRLALCKHGDIFGDVSVVDRCMQPYTATAITSTSAILFSHHQFHLRADQHMLNNFRRFRATYPNDQELKKIYQRSIAAVAVDDASAAPELAGGHIQPVQRQRILATVLPEMFGKEARKKQEDRQREEELGRQRFRTQKMALASPASIPSDHAVMPAASSSPSLAPVDASGPLPPGKPRPLMRRPGAKYVKGGPEAEIDNSELQNHFGLLAATDVLVWGKNANNSLAKFMRSLGNQPRKPPKDSHKHKGPKEDSEAVKKQKSATLDITEMLNAKRTSSEEGETYVELLESSCVLLAQVVNVDTQGMVVSKLADAIFEAWTDMMEGMKDVTAFRWSSDKFLVVKFTPDQSDTRAMVRSVVDLALAMEETMTQCYHDMAARTELFKEAIPAVNLVAGLATGSVFVTYSRIGRFPSDVAGAAFDAAMFLCTDGGPEAGIRCTDGVREMSAQTHTFQVVGSAYKLQGAVKFPFDQNFNTIFGSHVDSPEPVRKPHGLCHVNKPLVQPPLPASLAPPTGPGRASSEGDLTARSVGASSPPPTHPGDWNSVQGSPGRYSPAPSFASAQGGVSPSPGAGPRTGKSPGPGGGSRGANTAGRQPVMRAPSPVQQFIIQAGGHPMRAPSSTSKASQPSPLPDGKPPVPPKLALPPPGTSATMAMRMAIKKDFPQQFPDALSQRTPGPGDWRSRRADRLASDSASQSSLESAPAALPVPGAGIGGIPEDDLLEAGSPRNYPGSAQRALSKPAYLRQPRPQPQQPDDEPLRRRRVARRMTTLESEAMQGYVPIQEPITMIRSRMSVMKDARIPGPRQRGRESQFQHKGPGGAAANHQSPSPGHSMGMGVSRSASSLPPPGPDMQTPAPSGLFRTPQAQQPRPRTTSPPPPGEIQAIQAVPSLRNITSPIPSVPFSLRSESLTSGRRLYGRVDSGRASTSAVARSLDASPSGPGAAAMAMSSALAGRHTALALHPEANPSIVNQLQLPDLEHSDSEGEEGDFPVMDAAAVHGHGDYSSPKGKKKTTWKEQAWEVSMGNGSAKAAEGYIDTLSADTPDICLSTSSLAALPDLARFSRLEVLAAGYNQMIELPPLLFRLMYINRLYLNNNCLTELPVDVARLWYLRELNIGFNALTSLPQEIGKLQELEVLIIHGNEGITKLPDKIGHLASLRQLHCGACGLTEVTPFIVNLSKLARLCAADNHLTYLPSRLDRLRSLQELDLSNNQLTRISAELYSLPRLHILNLANNLLTTLPDGINRLCGSLKTLRVESNQITSLPSDLFALTKLEDLCVQHNSLEYLPDGAENVTSLTSINCEANQLVALPQGMGALTRLERLKCSKNQILELPEGLGTACQSLRVLTLAYNQLTELPTTLGQVHSLQSLELDGNPLRFPSKDVVAKGRQAVLTFLRAALRARPSAQASTTERARATAPQESAPSTAPAPVPAAS